MERRLIQVILLLAFLVLPQWGRGQVDICFSFTGQSITNSPDGWVAVDGGGNAVASSRFRVISSGYSGNGVYIYPYQADVYAVMPEMDIDYSASVAIQFYAQGASNIEVGTMSDPFTPSTFISEGVCADYGSAWHRYVFELNGLTPSRRFICFRVKTPSVVNTILDEIYVTQVNGLAGNFKMKDVVYSDVATSGTSANWSIYTEECSDDTVCIAWTAANNPGFIMTLLDSDGDTILYNYFTMVDSVKVAMPPGTYTLRATSMGVSHPGCVCSFNETFNIVVNGIPCDTSECVNTNVLFTNKAIPYYGSYSNPYEHIGNVTPDNNPATRYDRHLICTDTGMYDPIVGWPLRIVPPGDDHSIRLGNWSVGSEAEAMLYTVNVDTTDFDMLILKYAAVMQDPIHDSESQPRFRIEMLDHEGNLIEPAACNSYDFVASPSLGWNTIYTYGTMVLWKDWTIVGVDVSAYHGQSVNLRLTTYDCAQGAHYGYAYYNIACAKKTISFSTCSEGDSNRVEAPEGFNYSWHRDDSDSVISTARSVTIPADNHYYYCRISFIGDPSCYVTLSALSRYVWPEADFDYTVSRDDCRFRVDLHDRSHYVDDTIATCDSILWNFGPYGTSSERNPVVYITDSGTFPITLVASIPGGDCFDTLVRYIHLAYAFDTVDTAICANQSLSYADTVYSQAGSYNVWASCDSIVILRLSVKDTSVIDTMAVACHKLRYRDSTLFASGTYDFVYTNAAGCDSTYRLHLTVNPVYDTVDTIVVCAGRPYVYRGVDYGGPVTFDTVLSTVDGCDSLVHVAIVPRGTGLPTMSYYSFDGIHWADTLPIKGCAPATLYLRDTTPRTVSRLWTLVADTVVSAEGSLQHLFAEPCYNASATLEITDIYDCADTIVWPIFIFPSPVAEFAWQPTNPADVQPEAQLLNYTQPEDCRWLWLVQTVEGGTDSLTDFAPYYRWQGDLPTGDFDVALVASRTYHYDTVSHTCADTDRHTITIVTVWLQFPNLVTPNGDGHNDRWEIVNLVELGQYPMNELWIYNQWGILVFHAKDVYRHEDFWDPDATESPDGTYYYRFMGKNAYGIVRRNGLIEVLR